MVQQTSEQMNNNTQKNKGGFYMFNKFKHIKNEKGLTLIELLAVIVILAIIAVIAIPAIGNIINSSRDKAQVSDALNIIAGGKLAHIELGCGEDGCGADDLKDYVDGKGEAFLKDIEVTLGTEGWVIANFPFEFKSKKFLDKKIPDDPTENELKAAIGEEETPATPGDGG